MFKNKYLLSLKREQNKISLSNIEKRLLSSSLWNLVGNGIARLIMMIASVFLARILGAEGFGKWGVIRSTISMFTLFLSFSLSVTAIKHLAQYRKVNKEKAGRIFTLSFLMAIIFGSIVSIIIFLFSKTIALDLLNDLTIDKPLKITAFFIVFMSLNSVLTGALSGLENFKFIAISNFIAGSISAPIIIVLTSYFALLGITWGYLLYYIILFITLFLFLRKELKNNQIEFIFKGLKQELQVLYKFSLPALVSGSIGGPAVFAVYAFVANINGGFIMIGLFNAAKIFQMTIVELGSQLQNPLLSLLSNEKKSNEVFSLNFTIPILFITISALPIIYIPEMVAWIFNKGGYNVNEFTLIISITLLTASIMLFKQGVNRMIVTNNLLWWGVYENIFWTSLLLLLSWILIPKYGALGLAMAFNLAYFIDLLVIIPFYYSKRMIPKSLFYSLEIIVFGILFIFGTVSVYLNIDLNLRVILLIMAIILMYAIITRINKKLRSSNTI